MYFAAPKSAQIAVVLFVQFFLFSHYMWCVIMKTYTK